MDNNEWLTIDNGYYYSVVLFLVFHSPKVILNIADIFSHYDNRPMISPDCGCVESPYWYIVLLSLSNLCLTMNRLTYRGRQHIIKLTR